MFIIIFDHKIRFHNLLGDLRRDVRVKPGATWSTNQRLRKYEIFISLIHGAPGLWLPTIINNFYGFWMVIIKIY